HLLSSRTPLSRSSPYTALFRSGNTISVLTTWPDNDSASPGHRIFVTWKSPVIISVSPGQTIFEILNSPSRFKPSSKPSISSTVNAPDGPVSGGIQSVILNGPSGPSPPPGQITSVT